MNSIVRQKHIEGQIKLSCQFYLIFFKSVNVSFLNFQVVLTVGFFAGNILCHLSCLFKVVLFLIK